MTRWQEEQTLRSTSYGTPARCRNTCVVTVVWRCDLAGAIFRGTFSQASEGVGCRIPLLR